MGSMIASRRAWISFFSAVRDIFEGEVVKRISVSSARSRVRSSWLDDFIRDSVQGDEPPRILTGMSSCELVRSCKCYRDIPEELRREKWVMVNSYINSATSNIEFIEYCSCQRDLPGQEAIGTRNDLHRQRRDVLVEGG